jgi:methionine synthase / methylenetetrahydrofolate reductase(NADPH)
MSFLSKLKNQILIADGAMGTLLYSYGKDSCLEELNLSSAQRIEAIHHAYIDAGADVIQTNTYSANYLKLRRYGLEDSVKEINTAAIHIAKKAAKNRVDILGTIGGNRGIRPNSTSLEEIKRSFREQLYCLLLEGVDGILLETYYDREELVTILEIARKETKLPIIAQVSLQEIGFMQDRTPVSEALSQLEDLGADVIGLNCRLGPHHMLKTLEEVPLPKHAFLSAYPNASLPTYTDGVFHYEGDSDYFRKSAPLFRDQGIRLLGGCCGTTPAHIRAFAEELRGVAPITEKIVDKPRHQKIVIHHEHPRRNLPSLQEIVIDRPSILVELDPPRKLDTTRFFEGARALKEAGIDAITLADNSLASPRICNTAIGQLVKNQIGLRPLIHLTCRDRNIIGLQSHLMGLHTLGLHDVLVITGDPARVGDFPGASSVYDVSSFELISMMKQLNEGLSISGKDLGQKTNFSIAGAFNPNVRSLEKAVIRLEKKIECGADYFITQPVFSEEKLLEVYEATRHIKAPIYIGLMPLTSHRNTEFLHHEVPGIKISDSIRGQMEKHKDDPIQACREGLEITKSLIDAALELFNGIYFITPFLRFELSVELTNYTNQQIAKVSRRKDNAQSIIH